MGAPSTKHDCESAIRTAADMCLLHPSLPCLVPPSLIVLSSSLFRMNTSQIEAPYALRKVRGAALPEVALSEHGTADSRDGSARKFV